MVERRHNSQEEPDAERAANNRFIDDPDDVVPDEVEDPDSPVPNEGDHSKMPQPFNPHQSKIVAKSAQAAQGMSHTERLSHNDQWEARDGVRFFSEPQTVTKNLR